MHVVVYGENRTGVVRKWNKKIAKFVGGARDAIVALCVYRRNIQIFFKGQNETERANRMDARTRKKIAYKAKKVQRGEKKSYREKIYSNKNRTWPIIGWILSNYF